MKTLQDILLTLTHFWTKQGCIFQQGYDLEVGAGTFNPATFLRSLGPEPYNTAYIEPSRRPQDGRYGKNPNRIQFFHQYQVIMKPSPKKIKQKYLQSLEALGIDRRTHDIRFVHDDWESPTLGAWGLGWEVWIDGMEVTQFTYFQSVAGIALDPIPVEITYGVERIAMVLQKKENIFDLKWSQELTFGEVFKQNEIQWSYYNFEKASTEMWLRHFNDFETEANRLMEENLPLPAYDFVMKASHAFNMLEARGVLSVTERTGYIHRIRNLSQRIAISYLQSRKDLGYPLLKKEKIESSPKATSKYEPKKFDPEKERDFVLEILSEELPASFVPLGMKSIQQELEALLKKEQLSYKKMHLWGTPRRLVAYVEHLKEGVKQKVEKRKGPPLSIAFDTKGMPTKAGKGFFDSLSLPSLSLEEIKEYPQISIETSKGSQYLFATLTHEKKATAKILEEALPLLLKKLTFPKTMRWGEEPCTYARPIHSFVALFGSEIIPFTYASVISGKTTYGHAQRKPATISLRKAEEYVSLLREYDVLVRPEERKERILTQLEDIQRKANAQVVEKEKVLQEVLFLSEYPELSYTSFDAHFLKAPDEILVSEMVEHQRYFPLADAHHKLLNLFVITCDTHPNETIKEGNKRVLSARLSDGVFLFEQDSKTSLDLFVEKLKTITFQKELGSLYDKTQRILSIALDLSQTLGLGTKEKAKRAATLCKADLASLLVDEFPELQGTIGKHYALHQKEDTEVALAIEEHWLPKSEAGQLPQSDLGRLLSLADKIDNLLSYFSIGLKPSSSSDPYALRRQTFGIIRILIENRLSTNLQEMFQKIHPSLDLTEILSFLTMRAKTVLESYDFQKDEIEAVLQGLCIDPYDQFCKTKALHEFRKNQAFKELLEVFKRAKGQLNKRQAAPSFDPNLLQEEAEKNLYTHIKNQSQKWEHTLKNRDYVEAFSLLASYQRPLGKLFDQVKILDEDQRLCENRLALLQHVLSKFSELLDFNQLQENRN